jgi:hypothetical protein
VPVRGSVGPQVDVAETTRVVDFNDADALERRSPIGDVAAVLIEPALTNVGIVLPSRLPRRGPRHHAAHRHAAVIDETHTICAGPGGATGRGTSSPTLVSSARRSAAGSRRRRTVQPEVAARIAGSIAVEDSDVGGIGGTLAGYALSLAAIRATLGEVLTADAFERMIPLAERWEAGVNACSTSAPCRGTRHAARRPGRSTTSCRIRHGPARSSGPTPIPDWSGSSTCGDEPRASMHDAVPQHGADVAGHDRADVDRHTTVVPRRSRRCSGPDPERSGSAPPGRRRSRRSRASPGSSRPAVCRSVGASALTRSIARFTSTTSAACSRRSRSRTVVGGADGAREQVVEAGEQAARLLVGFDPGRRDAGVPEHPMGHRPVRRGGVVLDRQALALVRQVLEGAASIASRIWRSTRLSHEWRSADGRRASRRIGGMGRS